MKNKKLTDRWFKAWFEAMPYPWQQGLYTAINGGAFRGDMLKRSGQAGVVVFFVHPDLADRVEFVLKAGLPK